ncbi:hypothetical protein KFE25_003264 [Diacronema lutheri]|uniref:GH18 domain-containing protein n=2 Tax=Diacronema lutheri TaxID=2081491 RepID=A0A8J5X9F8_DIALT|nr:hypothetical protein KFE25_003264 [Diacronema lutheri]
MRRTVDAPLLPDRLLVGYASWSECDDRVIRAARQGVNVIVWFAINFLANATGHASIGGGPDLACVRTVRASLEAEGLPTVHMISLGGWNAPHPPDKLGSSAAWWEALSAWSRAGGHSPVFDGLDIDLEGSDAPAPSEAAHVAANTLSVPCLTLIGELSVLAKRNGWLVSLAPPQSYLTASTPAFNRTALQPALGWPHSHFRYAGRNAYAFLLAKYGQAPGAGGRTFDWVFVQLYESFSLAHAQLRRGEALGAIFAQILAGFARGWRVDFGADAPLDFASTRVRLPPVAIVLGLANGWAASRLAPRDARARCADEQPVLFACPHAVREAHAALPAELQPRGFGFWSIASEGELTPCAAEQLAGDTADGSGARGALDRARAPLSPLFLARALNDILHTRT